MHSSRSRTGRENAKENHGGAACNVNRRVGVSVGAAVRGTARSSFSLQRIACVHQLGEGRVEVSWWATAKWGSSRERTELGPEQ